MSYQNTSRQHSSRLPFIDNSPLHLQLRIFQNGRGGGFTAELTPNDGMIQRFPIELKLHDVDDLNADLQQSIQDVAEEVDIDNGIDENNSTLVRLAQKGNYAFKKIFAEGPPREIISTCLRESATIQFSSEDFFIPWELVYDGPIGDQCDVSHFWETHHTISRVIIRNARTSALVSPVIQADRPHVGLIVGDGLEYIEKHEIPALRKLQELRYIHLSSLEVLDANKHDIGLKKFGLFLRKDIHIAHLACHAYEENPKHLSYLSISNEFPVSIENFGVHEFYLEHHPFVILNACLTGTLSPLYTSSWAALFWERGARGVLATEFQVPDWFAATFSEELYHHLLSGMSIGQALASARHYFWKEHHNPLGLAYALYSAPSVRIATRKKKPYTKR